MALCARTLVPSARGSSVGVKPEWPTYTGVTQGHEHPHDVREHASMCVNMQAYCIVPNASNNMKYLLQSNGRWSTRYFPSRACLSAQHVQLPTNALLPKTCLSVHLHRPSCSLPQYWGKNKLLCSKSPHGINGKLSHCEISRLSQPRNTSSPPAGVRLPLIQLTPSSPSSAV